MVGKTEYFAKDSRNFVNNLEVTSGHKLISYNVSALFTSILNPGALWVIKDKLVQEQEIPKRTPLDVEQILTLLEFCLNTTYFLYNENYHQQTQWAAMGSLGSQLSQGIDHCFASSLHLDALRLWSLHYKFVKIEKIGLSLHPLEHQR